MPDLAAIFARHDNSVLAFSGGKDSLVCLHLCRPYPGLLLELRARVAAVFLATTGEFKNMKADADMLGVGK